MPALSRPLANFSVKAHSPATDEAIVDTMANHNDAQLAEARLDWGSAQQIWSALYHADRHDRTALLGLIRTLCNLDRLAEAESLFADADAHHANHIDYATSFAQTAQRRSSLVDALQRNLDIVRRFPDQIHGHAAAVVLLIASNQIDQATEMLRTGQARFPGAFDLLLPAVHVAVARQDWTKAAATLELAHNAHPDQTAFAAATADLRLVIAGGNLRDLGRAARDAESRSEFAEALDAWQRQAAVFGVSRENSLAVSRCHQALGDYGSSQEVLCRAAQQYPDDPEIDAHFAGNATKANDLPTAARRWREVVLKYPEHPAFPGVAAIAFARVGAIDEAECLLQRAIAVDPNSLDFRSAHAVVAQFAGDWRTAVQRWEVVTRLAPHDDTLRNLHGEAIWHFNLDCERDHQQHDETAAPQRMEREKEAGPSLDAMLTHFESIGDNCEFGLVQRHFGTEPVCLFRFSVLQPSALITLLDLGMEPLGDPEHTVIVEEGNEYVVKDNRGFYWMHSFLRIGQVEPSRYLRQQSARISLLKRKFLSDLRSGNRIYVCKQSGTQILDETLEAVSHSLRAYGDNMLLGIRRSTPTHPSGTVHRIDQNILVGYISSLFNDRGDTTDYHAWEQVIRTAYPLTRSPGQTSSVPEVIEIMS